MYYFDGARVTPGGTICTILVLLVLADFNSALASSIRAIFVELSRVEVGISSCFSVRVARFAMRLVSPMLTLLPIPTSPACGKLELGIHARHGRARHRTSTSTSLRCMQQSLTYVVGRA